MTSPQNASATPSSEKVWEILESLVSPDINLRTRALDRLEDVSELSTQPLLVYVLATRLLDPDINIRTQAVKLLHDLLNGSGSWKKVDKLSLEYLAEFLAGMGKEGMLKLLAVSANSLAAEEAVGSILGIASYAGDALSGIVNDRKTAIEIRQQAVFYAGEIGFISTIPALKNLVVRLDKQRGRSADGELDQDLETLYLQAAAALSKLEI